MAATKATEEQVGAFKMHLLVLHHADVTSPQYFAPPPGLKHECTMRSMRPPSVKLPGRKAAVQHGAGAMTAEEQGKEADHILLNSAVQCSRRSPRSLGYSGPRGHEALPEMEAAALGRPKQSSLPRYPAF